MHAFIRGVLPEIVHAEFSLISARFVVFMNVHTRRDAA
jgi:hypothetical protein